MIVAYTASLLCVMCFWLAVTDRVRTPLLMDIGLLLMGLGMFFVAEGIFTGTPCSGHAIALRWIFNGGGVFLMLVSAAWHWRKEPSDVV